jgi:hypothetical protein
VTTRQVRIPLASAYNTRMSAAGSAPTSSGYVGVGIVGLMVVGRTVTATTKDARYINCFAQTVTDQISSTKRLYVVKRPGFGTQSTPASGERGYGVFVWTGKDAGTDVISAFGATNSTIYNGASSIGAITGRATGVTETVITTTPTLTVTSSDSTAWYYDTGVGTMTKITDSDFPGNAGETVVGTFAHIDGFPCIMTASGKLYAGDLNTVTAWTANSFTSTNAYPDKGIGCVRFKNFIMAFGTESCEFWYNAGLSPFPLARATALTIKVGAVSADAIGEISDTKFWVGSTPQGGLSVFQYDGSLSRVSNPEQDAALVLAGASNISLSTLRLYGRSFVLVNTGSTTTYAYCIEEKMWHEWTSTTVLWTKCAGVSLGSTMVNYAVSSESTSGKVYLMNNASLVFTDDSVAYTARVQTSNTDLGTQKRKFWGSLDVVGDEEASTSNVSLLYSDDDYQSYKTWGTIDLSATDRKAYRLGSSKRRAWVLEHSANTPMRLEALELSVEIGR